MPAAPGECASGGRMASPPLSQECLSLAQPGRTTVAFLPEKQTPFARLQGRGMSTMARPAAAVAVGRERLQEASHLHGPQTHTVSQELFILRAELSFPFQPSCLWWNFWVSWPTWVSRPASHQQDMVTRGHIGVATGWPLALLARCSEGLACLSGLCVYRPMVPKVRRVSGPDAARSPAPWRSRALSTPHGWLGSGSLPSQASRRDSAGGQPAKDLEAEGPAEGPQADHRKPGEFLLLVQATRLWSSWLHSNRQRDRSAERRKLSQPIP